MRVVKCLFYVEDSFSVEGANPLIGGEFLGLEEGSQGWRKGFEPKYRVHNRVSLPSLIIASSGDLLHNRGRWQCRFGRQTSFGAFRW